LFLEAMTVLFLSRLDTLRLNTNDSSVFALKEEDSLPMLRAARGRRSDAAKFIRNHSVTSATAVPKSEIYASVSSSFCLKRHGVRPQGLNDAPDEILGTGLSTAATPCSSKKERILLSWIARKWERMWRLPFSERAAVSE
jgi:hypothetical protein